MPAVILRGHRPGEVERGARDVGMDIDATGEDEHAGRIDHAAALDLRNDPAVRDAKILDHAVDAVGGIVDLSAGDSQHGVSVELGAPFISALAMLTAAIPASGDGHPRAAWRRPP